MTELVIFYIGIFVISQQIERQEYNISKIYNKSYSSGRVLSSTTVFFKVAPPMHDGLYFFFGQAVGKQVKPACLAKTN